MCLNSKEAVPFPWYAPDQLSLLTGLPDSEKKKVQIT